METQTQTQTLLPSPTSSSSSNTNNNGVVLPPTPKQQFPHTRSESNPYPTTFVQADTSSFKQVVQMLTGSSDSTTTTKSCNNNSNNIPPVKTPNKAKPSKLYERRSTTLKNLRLTTTTNCSSSSSSFSPHHHHRSINAAAAAAAAEILSPSLLDFPSLVLSPVTPLIHDPFNRSPISSSPSPSQNVVVDVLAEEKAIAQKAFFLHPSPVSTPRDSEPRLLPLFPVSSPSGSNPTS